MYTTEPNLIDIEREYELADRHDEYSPEDQAADPTGPVVETLATEFLNSRINEFSDWQQELESGPMCDPEVWANQLRLVSTILHRMIELRDIVNDDVPF